MTYGYGYGEYIGNLMFGRMDNSMRFTRQNEAILGSPLYIAVTLDPIIGFFMFEILDVLLTGNITSHNQVTSSNCHDWRVF